MHAARRQTCKIGGYTRDRQGCLTCRHRKKKCLVDADEPRGRCTSCLRLNLRCIWENEQNIVQSRSDDLEQPTANLGPLHLASPQKIPVTVPEQPTETSMHRRMALRYYIQTFAGTLSTNVENNGFLSVLLPMAFESEPLMDALIAWSTSNLASHQDGVRLKAMADHQKAIRSFSSNFQSLSSEMSVAISLTFTSMESTLGNTDIWCKHLSGAASIIESTLVREVGDTRSRSTLEKTSEGRWLLRNFAYHDILASVSLGRDLLIPQIDWLDDNLANPMDTYLGLGSALVSLLGQLNVVSRQLAVLETLEKPFNVDERQVPDEVMSKLSDIEAQLLAWRPHMDGAKPLIALAEVYRSGTLICLYRVLRYYELVPVENVELDIASKVELIIDYMTHMPPGCLPECTLLFPLFIAGGETGIPEYQKIIEDRLNAIVDLRSFENIRVALIVLREVWDVRARTLPVNPARPYDWSAVLQRRKWQLALS